MCERWAEKGTESDRDVPRGQDPRRRDGVSDEALLGSAPCLMFLAQCWAVVSGDPGPCDLIYDDSGHPSGI
jgi:hypothetical protein